MSINVVVIFRKPTQRQYALCNMLLLMIVSVTIIMCDDLVDDAIVCQCFYFCHDIYVVFHDEYNDFHVVSIVHV
jgi:hypothetical protein